MVGEDDFWTHLRNAVNRSGELAHFGWCDWFEPETYELTGSSPEVSGKAGFVSGRQATRLDFTLSLPPEVTSIAQNDWLTLLPTEGDSDSCLSFDEFSDRMIITLSRAKNDSRVVPSRRLV